MPSWKKSALWAVGLFVGLLMALCVVVARLDDGMCATTIIDRFPSPDRQREAVLFQIDCGATTGFNSQVAIVAQGRDLMKKGALPQSFFAADGREAPAGKGGGPEVRIAWLANDRLEIGHHEAARILRAASGADGVVIAYKPFR
jgi:hypothetical protein